MYKNSFQMHYRSTCKKYNIKLLEDLGNEFLHKTQKALITKENLIDLFALKLITFIHLKIYY